MFLASGRGPYWTAPYISGCHILNAEWTCKKTRWWNPLSEVWSMLNWTWFSFLTFVVKSQSGVPLGAIGVHCCGLLLCYLGVETWSSQKSYYQCRDHLVGQLLLEGFFSSSKNSKFLSILPLGDYRMLSICKKKFFFGQAINIIKLGKPFQNLFFLVSAPHHLQWHLSHCTIS